MSTAYEKFAEQHGGNPVRVAGRLLFADGATSNGHDHIEPPDNPRALITLQIDYLNAKLREEEQKFQQSQPRPELDFEFTARQGCPRIHHAGRWVYENGAQWGANTGIEPPTDNPAQLLTRQVEYLAAALNQEEQSFSKCQECIGTQAEWHSMGAGPAPAEEAFTDLKRFKANIQRLRKKLRAKQTELAGHGLLPGQRYNERRNEQRAKARESVQRAMNVEI